MSSEMYVAGDVVWAPDPYNAGNNPRPWLVLTAQNLPYAGEEYICAGLTLSNLPDNLEVTDQDWVAGNPQKTSYCSPWVLATVKDSDIANAQGSLTPSFAEKVAQQSVDYLSSDLDLDFSDQ